jgi:hypothetical protein
MTRFDGTFPFDIPCNLHSDGTHTWIITTDDIYVAMPNGMCDFKIPKGTKSDGQSRPKYAPFAGAKIGSHYDIAWLVHDVQCDEAAECGKWFSRFMADATLGYMLWLCGGSRKKIWMTVLACLTYGRVSYQRRFGWQ